MAEIDTVTQIKPRLMPIPAAAAYSGISRPMLYRHAAAGKLEMVKHASRTLIVTASLDALIESFPAANLRAPKQRAG